MKVLIISPTQIGIGGIAQHIQGLTNFLQKTGHKVDVLSSENTFTLPVKGLKNPSFMISAFLKTKFKKGNDIVHAHNLPSALPMKHASGKKVLTLHGIYSKQIDVLHGKTIGNISSTYENDALTWADTITIISKDAHDYYTKVGFKVSLVPNAIDIQSLPQKKERLYDKQIIFAGRLSKEKGIFDLLEMSKKLPDNLHLLILGSGPEEEKVREVTKTQTNIHVMGYLPKERTISLIRGSDILIQPSLVEGLSSTILEAMACNVPIVATNVGGNKELLIHNKSGILLETNSPTKLFEETIELINSKEKAAVLHKEAFAQVQKYDWSHVGKLYLNIYECLLQ
ncbi:MAG: glycosyltransferase family 4 protein [Thaumarchaeota archaeon]|nr:MAG: glycosyltransferase family 4 protein [Nitrososphaerota archaeon]